MMNCTNPKYITNRTLHYDLFQPLRMAVPCGKCEVCKKKARNDWFVRCYYEWKSDSTKSSFFYTLTYNNENLPYCMGVPCFCKRHIQLFLKRLRHRLAKLGIHLKYIITCELGELKGRPHYHVDFFLDKEVNPYWFLRFVTDSWQYGFVKTGDNVGLIDSPSGIQYVTKYITKSLQSYENIQTRAARLAFFRYYRLFNWFCARYGARKFTLSLGHDYIVRLRSIDDYCMSDADIEFGRKFVTKVNRLIREVMPFHLQSTRLGACMLEWCDRDLEQVPVLGTKGDCKLFRIPRYIKRLLWYDCIEDETTHKRTKFVLNDDGKLHYFDKLQKQVEDDVQRLELFIAKPPMVDGSVVKELAEYGEQFDFQNVSSLVHFLHHIDLPLDILSIYKNVLRNRLCTLDVESEFNEVSIRELWKDYASMCLSDSARFDYGEISKNWHLYDYLKKRTFNTHPFFEVYEYTLQVIEHVTNILDCRQSAVQVEKDKMKSQLRDFFK